MQHYQA